MDKRRSALGLLAALALVAKRRKNRLSRRKKSKFVSGVAQSSAVPISPLKCGEVFILHPTSPFKLKCAFCGGSYDCMTEFGNHIRAKHLQSRTDEPAVKVAAFDHRMHGRNSLDVPEATYFEDLPEEHVQEFLEEKKDVILDIKTETEECVAFDVPQSDYEASAIDTTAQITEAIELKIEPIGENPHSSNQEAENKALMLRTRRKCNLKTKCRYCYIILKDGDQLKEHEKTHDRQRPYTCNICQSTFKSRSGCNLHHQIIHLKLKPSKCRLCPKAFQTNEKLLQHNMREHKISYYHECKICGLKCPYKSRLKIHMRRHTGERPYQCEICGLKFVQRTPLNEHMKRHNNVRNFKCTTCGKKFYSNEYLKNHLTSHTGERPFKCQECGKSFGRRNTLQAHRLIHSDVKKYTCDICGKQFTQCAGLSSHRKSH